MGVRISVGVVIMSGIMSACSGGDATAKAAADKADERPFETPLPLNTQPKRLALDGYSHTVGVKADGTVWAWGNADRGELGLGKDVDGHAQPVQIPGLTDVVEVAGGNHVLALRKDGTVWSWGQNKYGQLGYETEKSFSATPKQVLGLKEIVSVAAGSAHSLALSRDGSVYAFGSNSTLQLGRQPAAQAAHVVPLLAYKDPSAVRVVASAATSALILSGGKVVLWGNDIAQHGADDLSQRSMPHELKLPVGLADIVIGASLMVLAVDGSIWANGYNVRGELGQGNFEDLSGWHRVKNLGRVKSIATTGTVMTAVDEKGFLWAWGSPVRWEPNPSVRQLSVEPLPVRVPGVYLGGSVSAGMRLAVTGSHGEVFFWGEGYRVRARPAGKNPPNGDDAWFVPEQSSWTWK